MVKSIYPCFVHNNGNALCAVDVEVTGNLPGYHDMIQVCVLPLDNRMEPYSEVPPFYCDLKLKRPDHIDYEKQSSYSAALATGEIDCKIALKRDRIAKAMIDGLDPDMAADLFAEWFQKLRLAPGKRIVPLGQNYAFDLGFMIDWLGIKNYYYHFDGRFRDTQTVALFENDVADFRSEQTPYPKVNLSYLCTQMKIEYPRPHDSLVDAMVTARCYKQMIFNRY